MSTTVPPPVRSRRLAGRPRVAGRRRGHRRRGGASSTPTRCCCCSPLAILVAELFPVELPDDDGRGLVLDHVRVRAAAHRRDRGRGARARARARARRRRSAAARSSGWSSTSPSTRSAGRSAGALLAALTGDLPDENGLQYLELEYVPALVASAVLFLVLNTALASTPPALARGISPLDSMIRATSAERLVDRGAVALVPGDPRRRRLRPLAAAAARHPAGGDPARQPPGRHQRARGAPRPRDRAARTASTSRARSSARCSAPRAAGEQVGVLMVGLERFKEVNETLGHRRGDLVLVEVGRRLSRCGSRRARRRRAPGRRRVRADRGGARGGHRGLRDGRRAGAARRCGSR